MSDKPSLLEETRHKVTELNKPTVWIISALVIVLLGYILISSLDSSAPKHAKAQLNGQSINSNQTDTKLAGLSGLPGSYKDAKQIKNLMGSNPAKLTGNAELQARLKQLSLSQQQLERKLTALEQKPKTAPPPAQHELSAEDQQAMRSAIFFSGGAPNTPSKSETKTSKEKQKSNSAKNNANKASNGSDYAKQNNQAQKLSFLSGKPDESIYNKASLQYPVSPYTVQAGTVIPAILKSMANSDLPGNIVAEVDRNVYDSIKGQYLLIPKGSSLIGEYNSTVTYGSDRLQVKFTRLIRPDGTSITLPNSQGTDGSGAAGLNDEVDNHWGRVLGSAALMAVFNIPAIVATNQMNQGSYYDPKSQSYIQPGMRRTVGASALQSVGQSVSEVGSKIADRSLNIQPTILIHPGDQFNVLVTKDTILAPYSDTANA